MEKKVALITLVILLISMGLYYFTQSNVLGVFFCYSDCFDHQQYLSHRFFHQKA